MPTTPSSIGGHPVSLDEPVWHPLLELLGERLTVWFMWMGAVQLTDGRRVHAYKHRSTRRYIHLGEDGSAFEYTQRSTYRPLEHFDAVSEAFEGWEDLSPEPDMLDARALYDLLRALESLEDAPGTASA